MTTRRDLLIGLGGTLGAALAGGSLVHALGRDAALAQSPARTKGIACTMGTVTRRQTEGPYYTPNTPERRNIREANVRDNLLIVTGSVRDTDCRPIAGALIDFWQTGDNGDYDNRGYRYRGHQFTDKDGRFELLTIRPVQYSAMGIFRTPHIHAKLSGEGTGVLNTQLYLPDAERTNRIDGIFHPSLLMEMRGTRDGAQLAAFDFVLARG